MPSLQPCKSDGPTMTKAHATFPRSTIFLLAFSVTIATAFFLSVTARIPALQIAQASPSYSQNSLNLTRGTPSHLRCIRALGGLSREGLGAIIKRTQIPAFLASWFDVPIQYPVKESKHGYGIHELFDLCPDQKAFPKGFIYPQENDTCTLFVDRMYLPYCPRADCKCMYARLAPYVEPLLKERCPVINVMPDGHKSLQYSGCLGPFVDKHFIKGMPRPAWQYDAIHLRMGDLADVDGGKSFSSMELYFTIQEMCKHSNRDIVILTEGAPKIPACKNRIVLAADTSVEEAFQIMRFARTVAVAPSGFALAMLNGAKPERIIMRESAVRMFEWVDCELWTIISPKGSVVSFDSKELMKSHIFSTRELYDLTRRPSSAVTKATKSTGAVPTRRWAKSMMQP